MSFGVSKPRVKGGERCMAALKSSSVGKPALSRSGV